MEASAFQSILRKHWKVQKIFQASIYLYSHIYRYPQENYEL